MAVQRSRPKLTLEIGIFNRTGLLQKFVKKGCFLYSKLLQYVNALDLNVEGFCDGLPRHFPDVIWISAVELTNIVGLGMKCLVSLAGQAIQRVTIRSAFLLCFLSLMQQHPLTDHCLPWIQLVVIKEASVSGQLPQHR